MVWKSSSHLVSLVGLLMIAFMCGGASALSLSSGASYVIEWEIISLNTSSVVMTLIFDWVSSLFLGGVLFISSMVMYYSGGYMSGDPFYSRFMYLVFAFVVSMAALILSPNLISLLLGWDGLGLISYVLVIYYQNEKSANAGMLTILSNRVGDVGIILSISLMFALGGWNLLFYGGYMSDEWALTKILICLAAMTKSAQIPFSAWLPAAMAAPTPVSALVHSSTLVTAGVYILIRFSSSFETSSIQSFLLAISCLTMFMAGLGANFEFDLKKIIALSTLSQLGVMMSVLSLGFKDLAFFHLLAHALFKALLFMCAGMIIHGAKESQDIRSMGGLVKMLPATSSCMNLANLALCGMPFLAGFYSKDLILEASFMSGLNFFSLIMYAAATGLTVCYTFRLIFYSLSGSLGSGPMALVSEAHWMMLMPMVILSASAAIGGALLAWMIFPDPYMICLSPLFKGLAILVSVIGALGGYSLNIMSASNSAVSLSVHSPVAFLGSMWFMPFLSTLSVARPSLGLGGSLTVTGDKGWSEYLGGEGGFSSLMKGSQVMQVGQENMVMLYLKSFFMWIIIIFFIFI
uniref:NADH-ubiquinone oxidoreductase chain 5 n=1 Tax=Ombrastacoides huonensis TaxID=217112 RepID=A0A411ATQ6_9EUCA|nr:NADH dehydrogenase subunit 5 [Ombrastacoides huonensis]QAX91385.1 NADH dehydrogenase subunit 5 [Ombrastacoides huonensis]